MPYVVVQVRLDSGPRLTSSWSGPDAPVCGQRAGVRFRDVGDGVRVAEFGSAAEPGTGAQAPC